MKRVLVTGHTGMLGRNLVRTLIDSGEWKVFGISKSRRLAFPGITEWNIDLSELDKVGKIVNETRPDVIVHTAAFTNLQYCESNKREAHVLHVELSKALAKFGSRLIYISTDSVFDGETGGYSESDPVYPRNYYAHSKLQGEWEVTCANKNSLIIRTNIYGFNQPAGSSLAEWALGNFKQNQTISGFSDVHFNPLYVGQLSGLILPFLLQQDLRGVIHTGSAESISKFIFLRELALAFGYPVELISQSVSTEGALKRPKNTTLNLQILQRLLTDLPTLTEGLRMFKSDYSKSYEVN